MKVFSMRLKMQQIIWHKLILKVYKLINIEICFVQFALGTFVFNLYMILLHCQEIFRMLLKQVCLYVKDAGVNKSLEILLINTNYGMNRGLRSPLSNQVPPPIQAPAIIQGSKLPPFSLSMSQCLAGLNPSSTGNPPIWPSLFFIFFPNPLLLARVFQRYLPNEIPDKHKNELIQQSYFFHFQIIKKSVKCSFINNASIRNTRLRFNPK